MEPIGVVVLVVFLGVALVVIQVLHYIEVRTLRAENEQLRENYESLEQAHRELQTRYGAMGVAYLAAVNGKQGKEG